MATLKIHYQYATTTGNLSCEVEEFVESQACLFFKLRAILAILWSGVLGVAYDREMYVVGDSPAGLWYQGENPFRTEATNFAGTKLLGISMDSFLQCYNIVPGYRYWARNYS